MIPCYRVASICTITDLGSRDVGWSLKVLPRRYIYLSFCTDRTKQRFAYFYIFPPNLLKAETQITCILSTDFMAVKRKRHIASSEKVK